jgi:L-aspartate oxidase
MTDYFDVLVIGSGAAGLYTALCLPAHYQVALISKDHLPLSASDWAQGGISAAIAPDDSSQLHIEDTLSAGAGLCDLDAVKFLVEEAPGCIESLIKMGVAFDRHGDDLALTLEAAHSRRRVLHAADTTGRAVVSILAAQTLKHPNISILSPAFALSLWVDPQTQRVQGISLIEGNQIRWLRANAVILATGGGGQVFSQTTNPAVSTGDGVAIAWRAGAILRDLEFFQFHPTALTKPGAPRFLISEAVRGEGAHLVDGKGYRFAFDYHRAGELAPRDIVSRAIYSHLQKTGEDRVWLDLRAIAPERIQLRFPNIIKVCREWGIDIFQEPIPVAPAAHYWMGGVMANIRNETSLAGLYAIGETASTGVHGANRLASNSLLECIVFGAQMAHWHKDTTLLDSPNQLQTPRPHEKFDLKQIFFQQNYSENAMIEMWRQEGPKMIWKNAGICRTQQEMTDAIAQLEMWRSQFQQLEISKILLGLVPSQSVIFPNLDTNNPLLRTWGETYNLLDVAYLILRSAIFRTESRGGHYRLDYPSSSPNWQVHTLIQNMSWWKSSLEQQNEM